ncbi:hypothetical protein [Candidatus Avelusimicrobium fimicolum]|uniref:hypothetical protein n=1 Tax=Candidatus Avelusimicrobium fimicolum TaxID=3416216 RepID=UPI003D0BFBD1
MITPMQMYWLLKLDDIIGGCVLMCGVLLACMLLSVLIFCNANEMENVKVKKYAGISFLLAMIGIIFFGAVRVFLPSTNQMAAIYVVPAIANNEKIQQIGGKTLDISNQLLDLTKEYLKDKAKDK